MIEEPMKSEPQIKFIKIQHNCPFNSLLLIKKISYFNITIVRDESQACKWIV